MGLCCVTTIAENLSSGELVKRNLPECKFVGCHLVDTPRCQITSNKVGKVDVKETRLEQAVYTRFYLRITNCFVGFARFQAFLYTFPIPILSACPPEEKLISKMLNSG